MTASTMHLPLSLIIVLFLSVPILCQNNSTTEWNITSATEASSMTTTTDSFAASTSQLSTVSPLPTTTTTIPSTIPDGAPVSPSRTYLKIFLWATVLVLLGIIAYKAIKLGRRRFLASRQFRFRRLDGEAQLPLVNYHAGDDDDGEDRLF
jgi:hypothetical protein